MTTTNWTSRMPVFALLGALALAPGALTAQTPLPPPVVQIFEELIRPGHIGMHAMTEAAWPRAFARANVPVYYLAMSSQSGRSRMWFMTPWNNLAELEASDRAVEAAPGLSEELDRIGVADAEHTDGGRTMVANLRPELSYDGLGLDVANARYMEVTVIRVRPGKEEVFTALGKTYVDLAKANNIESSWAMYQVRYGMTGPVFMMMQSRRGMGDFDPTTREATAWQAAIKPPQMAKLTTMVADAVLSFESNLFRFAPTMSYMSPDFIARDPAFWTRP